MDFSSVSNPWQLGPSAEEIEELKKVLKDQTRQKVEWKISAVWILKKIIEFCLGVKIKNIEKS